MKHSKIFNTEDVCGIKDGAVTMFYERVKPQPTLSLGKTNKFDMPWIGKTGRCFAGFNIDEFKLKEILQGFHSYPLNTPLYVREKWLETYDTDASVHVYYYAVHSEVNKYHKLLSCSTMPRRAARLWIEITNVQVVRVKDITEEQAKSMGFEKKFINTVGAFSIYRKGFEKDYVSKHGESSYQNNDYVFLYEFKLVKQK